MTSSPSTVSRPRCGYLVSSRSPSAELDSSQLERKIRLLNLASIGFQNIGQDLPYSKIAASLQIDPSEVETWVIDSMLPLLSFLCSAKFSICAVIRAGLLSGKLSQTTQTLRVIRSTARTFEREQWEVLEKRLLAWKTGLAGVLDIVAAARKRNEPSPQAIPPTTATATIQTQAEPIAA